MDAATINPQDAIDQMVQAAAPLQSVDPTMQFADQTVPQPGQSTPAAPATGPESTAPPWTGQADPNTIEAAAAAVHHGRLARTLDAVGSLLGGDQTIHITKKPDGSVEVVHDPSTSGEKWGRIAQAALGGLAQGFAAGPGPGGIGRAGAGGITAGMQMPQQREDQATQEAKQQNDANQKKVMFQANHAALDQQYVRNAEAMKEAKIKFNQEESDRNDAIQEKIANAPGSEDLGEFAGVKDLPSFAAKFPQAMKAHAGDGNSYLMFTPVSDAQGNQTGSHVIVMNKAMGQQIMKDPPPIPTAYYDPESKSIKTRDLSPAKGITWNDYNTTYKKQLVDNSELALKVDKELHPVADTSGKAFALASSATDAAEKQRLTDLGNQLEKKELAQKVAGRNVTNVGGYTAPPGTNPSTIQTTTKSGQPVWGRQFGAGDPNSAFENTSRQLALGEKTENDIPKRFGKGQPTTQDYSNRARQITQDMFGGDFEYNPKQIEAEYKDYTNGKFKPAYNAMDRLAGRVDGTVDPDNPPLLDQLEKAAKEAGLGVNAPVNDVVQWIKRRWGNDAAKALQFDLAETQKSLSQVTGNPTLGSSDTNLKLQQMQEAYGGDMTVSNLIKTNQEARKAINAERKAGFTNNRFLRRAYGGEAVTATPSGPTGGGTNPPAAAVKWPTTPPPQGEVWVAIPGTTPGHIPQANLAAFQKTHPNAQVQPQ